MTCEDATDGPGFTCGNCPSGFQTDRDIFNGSVTCRNYNECERFGEGCHRAQNCTDTEGSYECSPCGPGWNQTAFDNCEDINECNNGGCYPGVSCFNTNGGFSCGTCPVGYGGDGKGPNGCTPANCGSFDTFLADSNAVVAGTCRKTTYKQTCSAECADGFEGAPLDYQCQGNTQWRPVLFTPISCQPLPCDLKELSQKSTASAGHCDGAGTCSFKCNAGYSQAGKLAFSCKNKGWSQVGADTLQCTKCPGNLFSSAGDATCSAHSACLADEWEAAAPTRTSDRDCRAVSLCADSGQEWEVTGPTLTSDRRCVACERCAQQSPPAFRKIACTASKDATCSPCTLCDSRTQYERVKCTEDADATCDACPFGQFFNELKGVCQPWKACAVNTLELIEPNSRRDRVCVRNQQGEAANDWSVPKVWVACSIAFFHHAASTTPTTASDHILFRSLYFV